MGRAADGATEMPTDDPDRYEAVVESARDGVFAVDGTGTVTLANPAAADLFGADPGTLVGRDVDDLDASVTLSREPPGGIDPSVAGEDGTFTDLLWDLADADGRAEVEVGPGGRTLELGASGIGRGDETAVVVRDVTDQERLRQQLSVANRVLRHNLRTSTNLVGGHARILEVEADDEETAEHARAVRTEAERLARLAEKTQALRDLVGSGDDRAEVDLAATVRGVLADLVDEHPAVETAVDAPDRAVAETHPQFEVAVAEAAENAVVHAGDAGSRVEATVERDGDWWAVRVADEGPGIPEYERAVLDRDAESDLDHGSGIGLWLMRWVVDRCDGRLSFEENDPSGTVVSIRIPLDR
ncbi:hypothetical protein BRD00_12095 [Halobacteriales archaeon QS_8_69_26]|nr:MAG: hypothetical protein BRD00_12095 [Halobacteriales archaeon QS_8_69_26]